MRAACLLVLGWLAFGVVAWPATPAEIGKLIAQLGSDDFEVREGAEQKLQKVGEPALKQLHQVLRNTKDAEVRKRAAGIIRFIERNLYGLAAINTGHLGAVNAVAFLPDGKRALSADRRAVYLWEFEKDKAVREQAEHAERILCLAVRRDGKLAASGSEDRTIRVWEVETGKEVQVLRGHSDTVRSVSFFADGKRLLSGGLDGQVIMWDIAGGKPLHHFVPGGAVFAVAVASDGKTALSGGRGGHLRLWDVETRNEKRALRGHTETVMAVHLSADGKWALSGGLDKVIRLWGLTRDEPPKAYSTPDGGEVYGVALTPDGKRIVSAGSDKRVRVRDRETGRELRNFGGHGGTIWSLALDAEGTMAVTGSQDGSVRWWKLGR